VWLCSKHHGTAQILGGFQSRGGTQNYPRHYIDHDLVLKQPWFLGMSVLRNPYKT
jgi:hypothetical protein